MDKRTPREVKRPHDRRKEEMNSYDRLREWIRGLLRKDDQS